MNAEINLSKDAALLDKVIIEAVALHNELKYGKSAQLVLSCLQRSGVYLTKCVTSGINTETALALSRAEKLYVSEEKVVKNIHVKSFFYQQFYCFLKGLENQGYSFSATSQSDSEKALNNINIIEMVRNALNVSAKKHSTAYIKYLQKLKASDAKFNDVSELFKRLEQVGSNVLHNHNTNSSPIDFMDFTEVENDIIDDDDITPNARLFRECMIIDDDYIIQNAWLFRECMMLPDNLDESELTHEFLQEQLARKDHDHFRSILLSFYFYASGDDYIFSLDDEKNDLSSESKGRLFFHSVKSYQSLYYGAKSYTPLEMLKYVYSPGDYEVNKIEKDVLLRALKKCGISVKTMSGIIHAPIMNGIEAEEPSLTVDLHGYDILSSDKECYRQRCEVDDIKKKFGFLFEV